MGTTINSINSVCYTQLALLSYNSTGWSAAKADFINTVMLSHGILFCALQEHFKLESNLSKLDCFNGFEVFSVPAYKNNNFVHAGRPAGGLSLIYSDKFSKFATRLVCPNSHRVQGLKLNFPNGPVLFINTYIPTDPGCNNFGDNELLCSLHDVKYLIDNSGGN